MICVVRFGRLSLQLMESPRVILKVLVILRVHRIHLPLSGASREQWAEEELRKPTSDHMTHIGHSQSATDSHCKLSTVTK